MSEDMSDDLNTPGRELFPEYPLIHGMHEKEVEGLTDDQLDVSRPEKSWGGWSVRQQVSHIAFAHYRWFLENWGERLFGENYPRDKSICNTGGADRLLDPKRFHEMADLLAAVKDAATLAWEILGGETLGSMREKIQQRRIPPDARWASGDGLREWTENVTIKTHPTGFWRDETDPDLFYYDLKYTFRHVLWEAYAHLKTIQAHKREMGLPPAIEIPGAGYLKVLKWE
jgi:hypothetical protein